MCSSARTYAGSSRTTSAAAAAAAVADRASLQIDVSDTNNSVKILFTPTIPHCSMATLIGLSIRVKLLRSLPPRFKVDVLVTPGSHNSEDAGSSRREHCSVAEMLIRYARIMCSEQAAERQGARGCGARERAAARHCQSMHRAHGACRIDLDVVLGRSVEWSMYRARERAQFVQTKARLYGR